MRQPSPLTPAHHGILAMLQKADGAFVLGQALSAGVGIPMSLLAARVNQLRVANPELVIEGKKGSGYRLASPGTIMGKAPTVATIHSGMPGAGVPLHRRMAAMMAVLDLLPAKSAELVKKVALESGEDTDATLYRLISYGVEVHNDLVLEGNNPAGLRAAPLTERDIRRAGKPDDQVWQ